MEKVADDKNIVPGQVEGSKKDIGYSIDLQDENDARSLFMIVRNRLMSVNHWHEYSKSVSATFHLTDPRGQDVNRTAEQGDFFKIDLPAPASSEGEGFDWVQIEKIDERSNPEGTDEYMAIRVRPSSRRTNKSEDVAHFFKEEATSSFVVKRHGRRVTAAVYGRNEIPNTETSNPAENIRHAVVGTTAILGLSNIQWENLVKGLVETK